GEVVEAADGRHARDRLRLRVDDREGALEAGRGEVADQQVSRRVPLAGGTDDDDRGRVQDRADAQGLRAVLAGGDDGPRAVRRVDLEPDGDDAVLELARDLVAGGREDLQHRAVVREDLGGEDADAHLARRDG